MFEKYSHSELRETVKKIVEAEIPGYRDPKTKKGASRNIFNLFAEQGLTGLTAPESYGGLGLGSTASAAIMEEIAAVDLGPAVFLSVHLMISGLIERFGNEEQKSRYLPDLTAGKKLAAFALTESSAGSDAAAIKTTAKENKGSYTLQGEKCWISSAGYADIYLVFAKTDPKKGSDGISAFLVEAPTDGLHFGKPETTMGCELSSIATVQFDNVMIPQEQLLGEKNNGYRIALGGLAGGRINIGACAIGLSKTAIDLALNHLHNRQQFGKKLIEFQGLQFMLADLQMQFEAAKLLVQNAAIHHEENPSGKESRIQPSIAKCFATDAAMKITTDCVQLFGGAGYVREYQVERLMRDAKMLQIVEGTNQIQRVIIAREMTKPFR